MIMNLKINVKISNSLLFLFLSVPKFLPWFNGTVDSYIEIIILIPVVPKFLPWFNGTGIFFHWSQIWRFFFRIVSLESGKVLHVVHIIMVHSLLQCCAVLTAYLVSSSALSRDRLPEKTVIFFFTNNFFLSWYTETGAQMCDYSDGGVTAEQSTTVTVMDLQILLSQNIPSGLVWYFVFTIWNFRATLKILFFLIRTIAD